jgi:hypothetical protein
MLWMLMRVVLLGRFSGHPFWAEAGGEILITSSDGCIVMASDFSGAFHSEKKEFSIVGPCVSEGFGSEFVAGWAI